MGAGVTGLIGWRGQVEAATQGLEATVEVDPGRRGDSADLIEGEVVVGFFPQSCFTQLGRFGEFFFTGLE